MNMPSITKYQNFPFWVVIVSNLVSVSVYVLGVLIILNLGLVLTILYLAFILFLEFRLIRYHCVDCFYYGKTCGFGKGRLSALLFKKGDNKRFCSKVMTLKDMIPDLLVSLIPFVTGIILLVLSFDFMLFITIILLLFLSTIGSGFIRSNLTCKYCKQKEIGCPAEKLFSKKTN